MPLLLEDDQQGGGCARGTARTRDLARDIDAGRADGYDAADRIRSWRI